ncbi:MAG: alpha-L-fucosidase [Spirochaetales bacterium]|nr:alpha-L-fucosidase [Spirochaetales bacterium]
MKRVFFSIITLIITVSVLSCASLTPSPVEIEGPYGNYQADWAELDAREVPQWYKDAKFGIFIHWGVYSVPAYAPRGAYAEWYWKHYMRKFTWAHSHSGDTPVHRYHDKTYGKDFKYEEFAKDFTANNFDPKQWAELFQEAGAKYIAITSKHHEGFCLWPNEHASEMRNKPWNSTVIGPMRDILKELSDEVKKTSVKFGVYYSLYEWGNPVWNRSKREYIDKYMIPQFQKLVTKYDPSIIFADGEWSLHSKTWRSEEILAWLYNNSRSAKEIVVNDRWGMETRHKHGGYYTTEYGSGLADDSHPWEENRGIGWSYGFNQNEDIESYRSSQELILMLIDIASRGGNLLLNVGPMADGTIPEVQQQRLRDIGRWLAINGEAIYGTRMWQKPYQWKAGKSENERRSEFGGGYDILDQTINAKPGEPQKEAFFTSKGNLLYVIIPKLPEGKTITIDNLNYSENISAEILGNNSAVSISNENGKVKLTIPDVDYEYALTIRVTK